MSISDHGELRPDTEIFGYSITGVLGRGGMGTVYLAQQLSLNRQVALKVLSGKRSRNPKQVDSFLKEARTAGQLNHPNLVLIHAVHADGNSGLFCYSMEYVPGTTLTKLAMEQGPMKRQKALHITYQVAKALAHAHRNNMVHRDVKPDNILITPQQVAKLADLGLAHDRLEGISTASPKRLAIVGTPEFCSPEQLRNPQRSSSASDIYSLGACLYYMLAGQPPFGGETLIDMVVNIATEPWVCPPTIPPDCQQLLEGMLAKDPEDRYADGAEIVAVLDELAKGKPVAAPGELGEGDEGSEETQDESAVREAVGGARPIHRRRRRARRYR
jgi:eukaryotic-like serine/threonine-protein kinase